MAHDVFLSHSSREKSVADAVCHGLEARGIRCWVAGRDIRPGQNWGGAIVKAIAESVVMVLIFSGEANRSAQVLREVERAVSKGVTIIPFRIEDVVPSADLEYYLSAQHWLDAYSPPLEAHMGRLVGAVRAFLGQNTLTIDDKLRTVDPAEPLEVEIPDRPSPITDVSDTIVEIAAFDLRGDLHYASTEVIDEDLGPHRRHCTFRASSRGKPTQESR